MALKKQSTPSLCLQGAASRPPAGLRLPTLPLHRVCPAGRGHRPRQGPSQPSDPAHCWPVFPNTSSSGAGVGSAACSPRASPVPAERAGPPDLPATVHGRLSSRGEGDSLLRALRSGSPVTCGRPSLLFLSLGFCPAAPEGPSRSVCSRCRRILRILEGLCVDGAPSGCVWLLSGAVFTHILSHTHDRRDYAKSR